LTKSANSNQRYQTQASLNENNIGV